MVRHTFENLKAAVNHARRTGFEGADMASVELGILMKFARTNFAACNDLSTARIVVVERFRPAESMSVVSQVLEWLYAKANELNRCGSPTFVTGCDHRVPQAGEVDRCVCFTDECPWIRHTGTYA